MMRLEPRGENCAAFHLGLFEAKEGMHLVDVAANGMRIVHQARDTSIAGALNQLALALGDAPEDLIKKREPVTAAVADRVTQKRCISARYGNRKIGSMRRQRRKQGRLVRRDECHLLRR